MNKRKSNTVSNVKSNNFSDEIKPTNAKLVLFIFGIGPIIILFAFLAINGFFS